VCSSGGAHIEERDRGPKNLEPYLCDDVQKLAAMLDR
jgi:hypothetical protein